MKVALYTRNDSRKYIPYNKRKTYPEGTVFVLRYTLAGKRKWETLARCPTAQQALVLRSAKETELLKGVVSVEAAPPERTTVTDAVKKYLDYVSATKSKKTYQAYALSLREFQKICTKEFVDQITLDDLRGFEAAQFGDDYDARTVDNRLTNIGSFLHHHHIEISHHCKYVEKRVRAYSEEQINKLFAVSTSEELEVWRFFLGSGFREGEVAHAHYTDIDWELKQIVPRCKAEHGDWQPKDKEERCVPIPDDLIDMLRARRERTGDGLIFTNGDGNPEGHFLRMLQNRAEAAGLDGTWGLHVFRKSYATRHYRNSVLPQKIQRWLGHSDLSTTMRYLEEEDDNSPEIRQKVNSSFAAITVPLVEMEAPAQTM